MEENKKIKIKLSTIIIIILLLAVIALGLTLFIVLNKDKENRNYNQVPENNIVQNKIENPSVDPEKYANTDFDFKFLKLENEKENMIYSPLSIKYAFQMLKDGADGNTKAQIENVLGNTNLVKHDNIENVLSLANAIYIRNTYAQYIKEEYKNRLEDKYNTEVKIDEFKNAKTMNSWIENKTFGQIKDMISDNIPANPDNKMILINALAIDMKWKTEFDAANTYSRPFYTNDNKQLDVAMMNNETKSKNVSYYKDDKVTALLMDLEEYENEQMEFLAIMPNSDLSKYIENFDKKDLNNITDNLKKASETNAGLKISIPKFSFDYDLKLEKDMKALGITDAFSPEKADFSNMVNNKKLWVGGALHKANIDFTEKGVKAAAVTVIYMKDATAILNEEKPIEVKIDHPFMYVIRDKKSGEIWFVGTVYEPNSWENEKDNYEHR